MSAPRRLRAISRALEKWFEAEARDLPWRKRRTAYTALVSEAMLQQTQVARVEPKYRQFMRAFPTIKSLATADEQRVLALWQGLGYYSRAKRLHQAAQSVVQDHGGRVPRSNEELRQLPGVGRYTANAIASIVFGHAVPIVDGNVRRVLLRVFQDEIEHVDMEADQWCWARAGELVGVCETPGVLNESLMELGATLCTPRKPNCARCPLKKHCTSRERVDFSTSASSSAKKAKRELFHHAVVISRAGKILLEQRPKRGLWSSMWQVPTIEAEQRLPEDAVQAELPFAVASISELGDFVHETSHRRVKFIVYSARTGRRKGCWRRPEHTIDLPMGNAQRKVLHFAEFAM